MPKPNHHIFICTNQRPAGHPRGSCGENNAMALMEKMGMAIEQKGLFGQVLLTNTSCIGPCFNGTGHGCLPRWCLVQQSYA